MTNECPKCQTNNPDDSKFCKECSTPLKDSYNISRSYTKTLKKLGGRISKDIKIAGKYRIIEKLGEGGMGVVYKAEQQHPKRSVALKVIRGGQFADEYHIKLFQREIQALARLKHPGIADIYEAGKTSDGQHFFAMELVQGKRLNEYIRGSRQEESHKPIEIKERMEIFLKICDAVKYAHQHGVIHRDLKPSNILVLDEFEESSTSELAGKLEVKILDFGLARITDEDVAVARSVSEAGQIKGTLSYMSPEQAQGIPEKIDIRSDVYSLGVIFYELLVGKLPYDVVGIPLPEAVHIICEESPIALSRIQKEEPGLEITKTNKLKRDLETIVLKALEKEPERRYQSVSALAEDVERYLANQPILAHPPSTIYQLRKLVARHKTVFGFVVILFVTLLGFAITMTVQSSRIAKERDRAAREADTAKQVSEFLVGLFEVSDPSESLGETITAREILDKGAEEITEELNDQPLVQARLMDTMGRVYRSLGLYNDATLLVETALKIRRQAHGDEHLEVAESINSLAVILNDKGDYEGADSLHREVLAMRRKLLGDEHPDVALSMSNLAVVLEMKGDYEGAEKLFREALAMRRKLLGDEHPDVEISLNNLAVVLTENSDYEGAEMLFREVLAIRRKLLGDKHPNVANSLNNLAWLLVSKSDYEGAEKLFREALAMRRKLLGDEHPDVAMSMNNLASVLERKGDYNEAEGIYIEVIDMFRKLLGDNHTYVAVSLMNLAVVKSKRNDYDAAEDIYRKILVMFRKLFGDEHPYYAQCLNNLAEVLKSKGNYNEAEKICLEALAMRRKLLGDEHQGVAESINSLALILEEKGDSEESERLHREALAMRRKLLGSEHSEVADSLKNLGGLLAITGNSQEAEPLLLEAIEILDKVFPNGHRDLPEIKSLLGSCLTALQRYDEAEKLLESSYSVIKTLEGARIDQRKKVLERFINLYEAWNKPKKVLEYRELIKEVGEKK